MTKTVFDLKGGKATVVHTCSHNLPGRIFHFPQSENHKQMWQNQIVYSSESHVIVCVCVYV